MDTFFSYFRYKRDKKADKNTPIGSPIQPEQWGNSYFYPIDMLDQQKAGDEALKWMYENLPEVQAPINYIIDKAADVIYSHYRKQGKKEQELQDSKALMVLDKPNQYQTHDDFIKSYLLNRIIFGVVYVNRIKPVGFGRVTQLYILPSYQTKPDIEVVSKKDPRLNSIKGYIVDFGEGEIYVDAKDVVVNYESNVSIGLTHIKSRLVSAIMTSDSLRYNYEARVNMYKNRGAMGIISPTDPMGATPEQMADTRKQFYNETGVTKGKQPIRISSASVNYTNIGLNVRDLQLNENKKQDFETICSLLGLKPALFGLGNNTYNNVVQAQRSAWEDAIIPQFNNLLEVMKEVFMLPRNEYFKADYTDVPALQEDYEKKVNANSKAYNDGAITQQEYREAIGYEAGESKYKYEVEQEASSAATQGQGNQNEPNNT